MSWRIIRGESKVGIDEFGKNTVALSSRPIGIIGLFILLVYATITAGLVLGQEVTEEQRSWVIGFMIIFSCLLLYVFYNLVTKHPGKLFSPQDFANDSYFIEAVKERLHEDITSNVEKEINNRISSIEEEFKYEILYIRMLNAKSQKFNYKALSLTNKQTHSVERTDIRAA